MAASQPAYFNIQQFTDAGQLLVGGRLYTYAYGTTTLKLAYTDPAGTVPHTYTADGAGGQYIALNARGELPAALYLIDGSYDLSLKRIDGSTVWTRKADGVEGAIGGAIASFGLVGGTKKVGYTSGRTADDALSETKSILSFSGSAAGNVDNTSALAACRTGGYNRIRFPNVSGSANIYYFSGALPAASTSGATLDVDPGVSISVLDVPYLDPSVKVVRPTHVILSALNDDYWLYPESGADLMNKPLWSAYCDRDTSSIQSILCNSDLKFKQVTANFDTFTTFAPSSTSVSGVVIPIASASDYRIAFKQMSPGDEIAAQFIAANNATPVCMVRTATSYYGVAVDISDTAIPISFSKAQGSGTTSAPVSYMGLGTHASYAGYRSRWTIRANTLTNFTVLFNGMEVYTADTNDEIIEAGFGAQGSVSGTMTVQDWVLERGKKQAGRKPISIAFFGDSITAPTFVGSWPTLLTTMLDQYYGIRVNFIKNYAVSGANSTAQSALCTASNIAPYDWVLIMIGVNDIQGGVTETTYVTNLTNMINTCTSNGKRVVIGMPTMFYSQGQAGTGKGQATTAYETGKGIRSKCARLCADMGVPFVDTLEMLGPILANWVNSGLDTLATLGRDPTVFDNIHPTAATRLLFARAFAEKIAGQLMPKQVMDKSATLLPASNLANGWTFTAEPARWCRDASGNVQLLRVANSGTTTSGTVFYTLPENLRPLYTVREVCATDNGSLCTVVIDAGTGQMSVYNFPGGATGIALDGIRFPTR